MSEIPTSDWTWINVVADRFERAWKQGPRPRIEDYLDEGEPVSRAALLEELLRVEFELRRRAGEDPGPEEYSPRFSQHAELIRAAFGPAPDRPTTRATDPSRRRRPRPSRPASTPRQTGNRPPALTSATSGITKSTRSWHAAAWASCSAPVRSASTAPSPSR